MDDSKTYNVVYLDIAKAFDSLKYSNLCHKQ